MSDCHVGIVGIHGIVVKDKDVEHFRNTYRKGRRRTTRGTVMNGGRRRKSITRRKNRPTRIILRKMVEEKIIRRIRE
jgi:hypothetical protein